MHNPLKLFQKILIILAITSLVLFACLITAARLTLPRLEKEDIEAFLSDKLDAIVQIEQFEASWVGTNPTFQVKKLMLLDKSTHTQQASVNTAFAKLNLVKSLYHLRPEFKSLILSGLNLLVLQSNEDTFSIRGLQDVPGIVPATVDLNDLIFWFLTQEQVVLTNSALVWQKKDQTQLPFFVKQISILPKKTLEITADVLLAGKKSVPLLLYAKLKNPAKRWDQIAGEGYLKTVDLPITSIGITDEPFSWADGTISAELWGNFKEGALEAFGKVKAANIKLSAKGGEGFIDTKPIQINEVDLDLLLHKNQQVTELATQISRLTINQKKWPVRNLHLSKDSKDQKIKLFANSLEVSHLVQMDAISKRSFVFHKTPIQGVLKNIWIEEGGAADAFLMMADFEKLKMSAYENFPAFSNISGKVMLTPTAVHSVIESHEVTLSFPTLFRFPHQADQLTGNVEWKKYPTGWTVAVSNLYLKNQDGEVWGELSLEDSYLDNQSPMLRLLTTFKNLNGSHQSRYLPTSIMSAKTVAWLDKSIKKIELEGGSMVMAGPIQDFPFTQHEGHFEVKSNFHALFLNYTNGWPPIENGTGELRFEGNGMEVTLNAGLLSKTTISHLKAEIPDFSAEPVWLYLKGKTKGAGDDALNVLARSPLAARKETTKFSLTGDIELDLGLSIALNSDIDTKVLGVAHLNNNTFSLKSLPQAITKINGKIDFTEKTVLAKNLTGELWGRIQPFEVATQSLKPSPIIEVKTEGIIPITSLLTEHAPTLVERVRGETHYSASIHCVGAFSKEDTKTEINITSNLLGVEINLPSPLNKTKKQTMPLSIQMSQKGAKTPWELLATLNKANRLNLVWRPNASPTANIVLSKIDPADWRGTSFEGPSFQRLQVFTPLLELGQFSFQNTSLDIRPQESGLVVELRGNAIEGQAKIPPKGVNTPILIELQQLKLNSEEQISKKTMEPSDLPALSMHAKEVFYDQKNLGEVSLETIKEQQGISIQKLDLRHPAFKASLTGKWISENKNEQTHLQGALTTSNFEEFLKTWGFTPAIKSSNAKAEVNLNWNGSPGAFSLKKLRGDLEIELTRGSLLNIEPGGASRLFGLLSFQTLPRRLILDFSDLFGKGLSFDTIHGNFRLNDGNAYTCDAELRGPTARMVLQGRTGLIAKDYEQIASVSAKLLNTAPSVIVGIINPIAGAATWLGSQILEKPLGAITSVGYEITGTWDNPVVKQITLPKALQPWKIIPKLIPFFPAGQNKDLSRFCQPRTTKSIEGL